MVRPKVKIAPSILAADFARLGQEAARVEASGADWLHIDMMDGNFVPNLTIGPQVVAAINRSTSMFLDVHIMAYNPYGYIEDLVKAGADMITFHFEATENVEDTLKYIRTCNVKAGLSFRPETSMSMIPKFLDKCDMILLMTVNPGWGGQDFMFEVLEKIRFTRDVCNQLGIRAGGVVETEQTKGQFPEFDIQVDGGINEQTAAACVEAGANVLVAGSYLFQFNEMKEGIEILRRNLSMKKRGSDG